MRDIPAVVAAGYYEWQEALLDNSSSCQTTNVAGIASTRPASQYGAGASRDMQGTKFPATPRKTPFEVSHYTT